MTEPNEHAQQVALDAVSFLIADGRRLTQFCQLSGVDIADIRESLGSDDFRASVLDYLIQNEALLTEFAAEHGLEPKDVIDARIAIAGKPQFEL